MPEQYAIVHESAGKYKRGDTVTKQQVLSEGYNFDKWDKVGAIQPVPANMNRDLNDMDDQALMDKLEAEQADELDNEEYPEVEPTENE